jgi:predicted nicotinamide N-methyase
VPTPDGAEVAVSVRDATLSADALGSRTWGSAPLLARRLLSPFEAALKHSSQLRILELGAGTGLVGLALALYSQRLGIAAQVALTDYHPDVLSNLHFNASLNALTEPSTLVRRLDWQDDYAGASHAHETQTEEQRVAQTARDTWPSLEIGSWDALVAAGEIAAERATIRLH